LPLNSPFLQGATGSSCLDRHKTSAKQDYHNPEGESAGNVFPNKTVEEGQRKHGTNKKCFANLKHARPLKQKRGKSKSGPHRNGETSNSEKRKSHPEWGKWEKDTQILENSKNQRSRKNNHAT